MLVLLRAIREANVAQRFLIVPDTQVKPGVPTDHIDWAAQAIVEYKPDVVVHLGDHWDFSSLNSHEKPGSAPMEGARYKADIDAGDEAFARLSAPMDAEIRRTSRLKTPWKPRRVFLLGNHEDRADRACLNDPKFLGHIGSENCNTLDWERHPYLERVFIGGICFSHFFQNSHSGKPIGGSIDNRLNRIGCSFVQGHEQGFRYGNRIMGSGLTFHGLVAGSYYLHEEAYRGLQGQRHWRGLIVLNEVQSGEYDILVLSMDYLCRKFTGKSLHEYMVRKYPYQSWEHLGAHNEPKQQFKRAA